MRGLPEEKESLHGASGREAPGSVCVWGGGWTSLNFVTHSFLLAPALLDPV